jgi:hypothetical protein
VRAESDLQGHHRSGTPGCHRCGLPLMVDATYCPYCERWLEESPIRRLLAGRGTLTGAAARERLLLVVGLLVFGLVAAACIVAAVIAA